MNVDIAELEKYLNSTVSNMEDDLVIGYANIAGLLDGKLKEYGYCIVIGKKLDDRILDAIEDGPTPEYYALYNQVNDELYKIGLDLSWYLDSKKIANMVINPTGITRDVENYNSKTLTYCFSHKMAATRAGLGWIGKIDLIVTKKFGPRVRFVSILLKKPLQKNGLLIESFVVPVLKSLCGKCNVCVKACPAKAGSGKEWDVNTHRDSFFNAHSCMKKCRELSHKNLGKNATICGICVKVCPIGNK